MSSGGPRAIRNEAALIGEGLERGVVPCVGGGASPFSGNDEAVATRSSSGWSMLVDDTGCILLPVVSLNHHRLVLTPLGQVLLAERPHPPEEHHGLR